MAESAKLVSQSAQPSQADHKKLPRLPKNHKITKRPLLRPAIPSPHAGAQNQKVVYVTAKSPFLSAVKRVEKLLRLSEKRLVQSATTQMQNGKSRGSGKRKRPGKEREEDEILETAENVERMKKRKMGKDSAVGMEEVMLKGTGKAVQKCLELGLWFQQREEYSVRLETKSVAAIDDIEVDEDGGLEIGEGDGNENGDGKLDPDDTTASASDEAVDKIDMDPKTAGGGNDQAQASSKKSKKKIEKSQEIDVGDIPETRIRYLSSLEVFVSLR